MLLHLSGYPRFPSATYGVLRGDGWLWYVSRRNKRLRTRACTYVRYLTLWYMYDQGGGDSDLESRYSDDVIPNQPRDNEKRGSGRKRGEPPRGGDLIWT